MVDRSDGRIWPRSADFSVGAVEARSFGLRRLKEFPLDGQWRQVRAVRAEGSYLPVERVGSLPAKAVRVGGERCRVVRVELRDFTRHAAGKFSAVVRVAGPRAAQRIDAQGGTAADVLEVAESTGQFASVLGRQCSDVLDSGPKWALGVIAKQARLDGIW